MLSTTTARLVDPTTGNELISYGAFTAAGILEQLDFPTPAPRESTSNRSGMHGVLDTTRWAGARQIVAQVAMPSAPDTDTAIDNLSGLMNPMYRLYLYVQRPFWDTERRILVRGASMVCPPGILRKAQVTWVAPDALFEDGPDPTPQVLLPSGTGTGGLTMPVLMPATLVGGVIAGSAFVDVGGNAPAPFVIDMYGPCSDPLFRCTDTNEQIKFVGLTIAAGDFLRVDTGAQTALLNGLADQSRTNLLEFHTSNMQMTLPSGVTSQVVFSPSTPSGNCQAVLTWRSKWF